MAGNYTVGITVSAAAAIRLEQNSGHKFVVETARQAKRLFGQRFDHIDVTVSHREEQPMVAVNVIVICPRETAQTLARSFDDAWFNHILQAPSGLFVMVNFANRRPVTRERRKEEAN